MGCWFRPGILHPSRRRTRMCQGVEIGCLKIANCRWQHVIHCDLSFLSYIVFSILKNLSSSIEPQVAFNTLKCNYATLNPKRFGTKWAAFRSLTWFYFKSIYLKYVFFKSAQVSNLTRDPTLELQLIHGFLESVTTLNPKRFSTKTGSIPFPHMVLF